MKSSYTFYFEEVFPTYEDWQEFMQTYNGSIDYTNAEDANFDRFCYKLLAQRFTHCNIRYSSINAFKAELLNVYENKFKQYQKEKAIIDATYQLTLKDLELVTTALMNQANNPNTIPEDPLAPLEFISNQSYNVVSSNKIRSYLDAINNLPTLNIYKFFKANSPEEMGFEDLFMVVQPNIKYYYRKGENE